MKTFVFREELEQANRERRLRRLLEIRRIANVETLAPESGRAATTVRAMLEDMVVRGEVVRLRPMGYGKEDLDYFRPCRLPRAASAAVWPRRRSRSWTSWIENAKRAMRAPMLGRRQNAFA
jgi:hypothetical protein